MTGMSQSNEHEANMATSPKTPNQNRKPAKQMEASSEALTPTLENFAKVYNETKDHVAALQT